MVAVARPSHDALSLYLSDVRRLDLLSREEEVALARAARAGNTRASDRLASAHLRLVVRIARQYRWTGHELADLVQEGNAGLVEAVKRFDPERGVRLSTYAAWWIRAYVVRYVTSNWRLVRIGTTKAQRRVLSGLRREQARIAAAGIEPTNADLAARFGMPEDELAALESHVRAPEVSLDAPNRLGDDATRGSLLPGPERLRPDVQAESRELSGLVHETIARFARELAGRDRVFFRARWLADEPQTLQELGDRYGISRERARQIDKRILGKLRVRLAKEFPRELAGREV